MSVWMDTQEKGGMRALVEAACDDVRMSDDFAGDYAVGGYLIERKDWAEVAGRMLETDRDLYVQLSELVEVSDLLDLKPALLVEGEIGSPLKHSNMRPDEIARYLSAVPLLGVTVFPSTGRKCSARILARLEDGEPPDVTRVRGAAPSGVDPQCFVLEGVPAVGPSTAEALLSEFGSVRAVAEASEEELQEADGIGPATAGKVRAALNEGWEP